MIDKKLPPDSLVAMPPDRCPCGAEIAVSFDPPGVLHGMPMCAEFEKREVLNYLQWVSGMRGIQ